MKMYCFVNGLYMSPIQHGIQSAHAIAEMSLQNTPIYEKWAKDHKTIIILNAVNHAGLVDAKEFFSGIGNHLEKYNYNDIKYGEHYATSFFHEDEQSLGGILTSVAVLLEDEEEEQAVNPHAYQYLKPLYQYRSKLNEYRLV